MIERRADRARAVTLGADKAYDAADFVNELRAMNVRPHVAQNNERRGGSAIDLRTNQPPTTKELITRDQRRRASFFSSLLIDYDPKPQDSRTSEPQRAGMWAPIATSLVAG